MVLFIALIVMVALSLAGIALIRSTDTATIVTGNLAFSQAAQTALDRSVEAAIHALWDTAPPISDPTVNNIGSTGQNYFACVQSVAGGCVGAGSPNPLPAIPQIPDALDPSHTQPTYFASKNLRTDLLAADSGGNNSYYMIERMCLNTGQAVAGGAPTGGNCDLVIAPFGADAGTQHHFGQARSSSAYYRVTVRVEGPRNTVAYAQAILQ